MIDDSISSADFHSALSKQEVNESNMSSFYQDCKPDFDQLANNDETPYEKLKILQKTSFDNTETEESMKNEKVSTLKRYSRRRV